MKTVYTKPNLCESADGRWYVQFRYNGKPKKYKKGINRIKDLRERSIEGNALASVLHEKLKEGWNPDDTVSQKNATLNFIQAIDFALSKSKLNVTNGTFLDYSGTIRFMVKAIYDLSLHNLKITDVKRIHIHSVVSKVKDDRDWSNKSYNKNLGYFSAVLKELVSNYIIEINPACNIDRLKVEETLAHVPPEVEEMRVIKEELLSNHPEFYNYIKSLYYTGLRPVEMLRITIGDIDIRKRTLTLRPAKNKNRKKIRLVPINDYFLDILLEMKLPKYSEFYLFGSFRVSGKGNKGKHIDFIPGTTRIKRDTATARWRRVVKIGLGIDRTLYSIKKRSANDHILSGVSIDALKELFGHSSALTTKIYATEVHQTYRNEIMDKAPEM